jgi:hypothetical protein
MNGIQGSTSMPKNCGMEGMHNNASRKPVDKSEADLSQNQSQAINNGSVGRKKDITA